MKDTDLQGRLEQLLRARLPAQQATRTAAHLTALIRDKLHPVAHVAAVAYHTRSSPLSGLGVATGAVTAVKSTYTGASVGAAITGATSVAGAIGAGAAAGSVVPILGTAIGAVIGLMASGVFSHHKAAEDANFQQAMAISKQNPAAVLDIPNKYLVLAGLFDLLPGQIKGNIPIYKKYGRMGEQRFVNDMMRVIYDAGQAGKITATDTPTSVFNRIVQPWIDSFGFGAMNDSNTGMINNILLGMTAEYVMGGQKSWTARGGQYPFGSLPAFSLNMPSAQLVQAVPPATSTVPAVVQTDDQALAAQGWQRVGTDPAGHGIYAKAGVAGQYAWVNGNLIPTVLSSAAGQTLLPAVQSGLLPPTPAPGSTVGDTSAALLAQLLAQQGVNMQSPAAQQLVSGVAQQGVQQTPQGPPPTLVTAGGVSGLPTWLTVGAAVAALSFALARPMPSRSKRRAA